jgi:GTPase Era involved in 16S rRNA processing
MAPEAAGGKSVTKKCAEYVFTLDRRQGIIVDSPGFHDKDRSDAKILEEVADFLERT